MLCHVTRPHPVEPDQGPQPLPPDGQPLQAHCALAAPPGLPVPLVGVGWAAVSDRGAFA